MFGNAFPLILLGCSPSVLAQARQFIRPVDPVTATAPLALAFRRVTTLLYI